MSAPPKDASILKGKRLSEQVYDLLERRIVSGTMPPGSHIAEDRIARELGISRSPVRQAIAALQRRGLAEWADKRDRRVSIPSLKFVADVFDTSNVLESGRIYHSSRHAPRSDHTELLACLSGMTRARARGKPKEYRKLAATLRELLVRRCDNEKLNQLSREFDSYRQWILATSFPVEAAVQESDQEHRKIVECYIARDQSGLMAAVENHAARVRELVLAAFERPKQPLKPKRSQPTQITTPAMARARAP
jgi:DNA-binding GntR family transcriptional regulator